jgi:hypothetical protein
MDMAMEDFDGARDYLARHQIHEMWEACVAELVLHQHNGKQKITDTIVDVVQGAERRKSDPVKNVVIAVGLPETQFVSVVEETVASGNRTKVIHAGPNATARTVGIQVAGCQADTVVLLGFPRTLPDALTFEASVCQIKQCISFVTNDLVAEPTSEKAKRDQDRYLTTVNPVSTYYEAVDRATIVNLDDAKKSPVAVIRAVLQSLEGSTGR